MGSHRSKAITVGITEMFELELGDCRLDPQNIAQGFKIDLVWRSGMKDAA